MFWNKSKKPAKPAMPVVPATLIPIVRLEIGDRWYRYEPKETITVFQLAQLHKLFLVYTLRNVKNENIKSFLDEHNLLQHFDLER